MGLDWKKNVFRPVPQRYGTGHRETDKGKAIVGPLIKSNANLNHLNHKMWRVSPHIGADLNTGYRVIA